MFSYNHNRIRFIEYNSWYYNRSDETCESLLVLSSNSKILQPVSSFLVPYGFEYVNFICDAQKIKNLLHDKFLVALFTSFLPSEARFCAIYIYFLAWNMHVCATLSGSWCPLFVLFAWNYICCFCRSQWKRAWARKVFYCGAGRIELADSRDNTTTKGTLDGRQTVAVNVFLEEKSDGMWRITLSVCLVSVLSNSRGVILKLVNYDQI